MRLSRIPGIEPTVKHSFSFKQSSSDMLLSYKEACESQVGVEVALKDLVEQILLDFMLSDRTFQQFLKDKEAALAKEEAEKAKALKEEKAEKEKAAQQATTPAASPHQAIGSTPNSNTLHSNPTSSGARY